MEGCSVAVWPLEGCAMSSRKWPSRDAAWTKVCCETETRASRRSLAPSREFLSAAAQPPAVNLPRGCGDLLLSPGGRRWVC